MYTYPSSSTPTADETAVALEATTDRIRSAYQKWPKGHPLRAIVPGFLARTIAEYLVISNIEGFTEQDVRGIIAHAFTQAGDEDGLAGIVADAVCDDDIVN
ncbi:hypothetical protein ACFY05_32980 [Microtetraspora fusca]|uniref:Uncharacterized protein n=1 Tax=Microtetraspora fusca TaxID=1997 RepID=A0ABW6VHC2_MICFU